MGPSDFAAGAVNLQIQKAIVADLERHSLETYPNECCGVIVVGPGGDQKALRIRNIQDEMHAKDPSRYPRTAKLAYSGHPGDLKRALDLADSPGHSLLAFYHSHPDHASYFSDEDVAQATPFGEPSYPDALQIVISVYGDEIRDLKAFGWSAEAATFTERPVDKG
jgi:proteasome lid subunit RPN8/RPN11